LTPAESLDGTPLVISVKIVFGIYCDANHHILSPPDLRTRRPGPSLAQCSGQRGRQVGGRSRERAALGRHVLGITTLAGLLVPLRLKHRR
jgi:hypothetical protein